MPHIPRSTSQTVGVPAEFRTPPAKSHASIPVAPRAQGPEARRRSLGLPKINPHTYEPDREQLLKTLLGKEPDVDPHTGQLVFHIPATPTGPAVGD